MVSNESQGDGSAVDPVSIVAFRNVSFSWPGATPFSMVVDDFKIRQGERLLLLGASGSGKSTFLSLLCGINTADRGALQVVGRDLTSMSAGVRDRYRSEHIGVVFQMFNLLPYGSVVDNVVLPLGFVPQRMARARKAGGERAEARRLLAALGLEPVLFDGPASSLSVGQQQRVAVARALIGSPEIVVADEPTSALDANRQELFLNLLLPQVRAANGTLVMVSHDEGLAPLFDRVCQLSQIATVERPA